MTPTGPRGVADVLKEHDVIAFVATAQPDRALKFYGEVLGLNLIEDSPFALVFDVGGRMLRIQKVQTLVPAPHTVLGWSVPDIRGEIESLMSSGVAFERYRGMSQDELGACPSNCRFCGSGRGFGWKEGTGNGVTLLPWRA